MGVASKMAATRFSLTRFVKVRFHSSSVPVKDRLLPNGCLEGKLAFITGGGTGLGKGMAHMMTQLGATVGIASRYICTVYIYCC